MHNEARYNTKKELDARQLVYFHHIPVSSAHCEGALFGQAARKRNPPCGGAAVELVDG